MHLVSRTNTKKIFFCDMRLSLSLCIFYWMEMDLKDKRRILKWLSFNFPYFTWETWRQREKSRLEYPWYFPQVSLITDWSCRLRLNPASISTTCNRFTAPFPFYREKEPTTVSMSGLYRLLFHMGVCRLESFSPVSSFVYLRVFFQVHL